jgi:hypothetical protein
MFILLANIKLSMLGGAADNSFSQWKLKLEQENHKNCHFVSNQGE